jgi:hypothetical protein
LAVDSEFTNEALPSSGKSTKHPDMWRKKKGTTDFTGRDFRLLLWRSDFCRYFPEEKSNFGGDIFDVALPRLGLSTMAYAT